MEIVHGSGSRIDCDHGEDGIEVIGAVAYPPDYEEKQVIDRNACESTRKIAPSYGIEYPLKTKYGRQRLLHGVKVVGEHRKGFSVCGALALAIMLIVIVTPIALVIPKQNGSLKIPPSTPSTTSSGNEMTATTVANASPTGVLPGTRLATMDPRTGGGIFLYYQVTSGGLQYISMSPRRIWQGSMDLQITDALLGTSLATTSTSINGLIYWWLFYIDKDYTIQNIYSTNNPASWKRGSKGGYNYKIPSNAKNHAFALLGGREVDPKKGLSGTDALIHGLIFDDAHGTWAAGFTFPATNGAVGVSLWSLFSSLYLFTLTSDQAMEFWYRNISHDTSSKESIWTLGPTSSASVAKNSNLCGQFAFAFQGTDGGIWGSNFTEADEPEMMRWDTSYGISEGPAVDGTGLSSWWFFPSDDAGGSTMIHVFWQVEGGGVREAIRDWGLDNATVPGRWRYRDVPIH